MKFAYHSRMTVSRILFPQRTRGTGKISGRDTLSQQAAALIGFAQSYGLTQVAFLGSLMNTDFDYERSISHTATLLNGAMSYMERGRSMGKYLDGMIGAYASGVRIEFGQGSGPLRNILFATGLRDNFDPRYTYFRVGGASQGMCVDIYELSRQFGVTSKEFGSLRSCFQPGPNGLGLFN